MKEHELGTNEPTGLDEATADRLLSGAVAPEDAPQGFQEVARMLQAAAFVAQETPAESADAALAAFHATRPQRRIQRMKKWKVAAAALAGGLTLSTGLAAADVLPGAAQDVASDALAKVGISVPGNHDDHANSRGKSADHKGGSADDEGTVEDDTTDTSKPENHGSVVSNVARDDSTTGAEHGSAVCATASAGKCQPGAQGGSSTNAPSVNSTEGSANAGQQSTNSTEGEGNSGQGSANAGQSSSNSGTGGSSSTQTGGSGNGASSGSNVSSGTGG